MAWSRRCLLLESELLTELYIGQAVYIAAPVHVNLFREEKRRQQKAKRSTGHSRGSLEVIVPVFLDL